MRGKGQMAVPNDHRLWHAEFKRVLRYCERWGAPIRIGHVPTGLNDFHEGPMYGGIDWLTRTIWWPADAPMGADSASALLHELSHIVMDLDPEYVDEVESPMLAFEYYSARRLRLRWTDWMKNFRVDSVKPDHAWLELSTQERGALIAESLKEAIDCGILNQNGSPTYMQPYGLQLATGRIQQESSSRASEIVNGF
jgi:hypothetical protein